MKAWDKVHFSLTNKHNDSSSNNVAIEWIIRRAATVKAFFVIVDEVK